MPSQIQYQHVSSGVNLYAFLRHPTGTIWSTGVNAFISYTAGERTACVQPLVEDGTDSAYYVGNLHASVPANIYMVSIFQRIGLTPAKTDTKIAFGEIQLGPSGLLPTYNLPVNIQQISGVDISATGSKTSFMPANILMVTGQPLGWFNVNVVKISGLPAEGGKFNANIIQISGVDVQQAAINANLIRVSGVPFGGLPANIIQVTGHNLINSPINANITKVSGQIVNLQAIQTIPSGQFPYFCDIRIDRDTTNTIDEYTGTWYRNAIMVPSGEISSPTIQVINRSNGQNLIGPAGASGMSYISTSLGIVKYDERTNRIAVGEPYIVLMSANIDGLVKQWPKLIGRDG